GSRTVLSLVPVAITTDWVESRKFRAPASTPWGLCTLGVRERLARHRKDNRLIVGGLAALLAVFTGAFYLVQRSRELPAFLVTNRVLLFVLWYVNVVLILTVLFVLLRNLFKLVIERRHR